MGDVSAQDVSQAILTLYGTDHTLQANANSFLNQLAASDAAWEPCLHILEASYPAEVQFFCVNILLSKLRGEWARITPDLRQRVMSFARDRILSLSTGPAAGSIVCQRLCLLLAAACVLSGPEVLPDLIRVAIQMAQSTAGADSDGASQAACTLLLSLAEEIEGADRVRRQILVPSLLPLVDPVLGLLETLLRSPLEAGGRGAQAAGEGAPNTPGADPHRQATHAAALRTLAAWARLDFSQDGQPQQAPHLSPGALFSARPGLLMAVLQKVGRHGLSPQLLQPAVDALLDLFRPGSDRGLAEGAEEQEVRALALAYSALAFAADLEASEATATAAVRLAAALAELNPEAACGPAIHDVAEVAQTVLRCLAAHPDCPTVTETACEYFLMVSLVPLEERRAEFQGPLYASLVPVCLRLASFPEGFTTWAQSDLDDEAFDRLREHTLCELLDVAFAVLKGEFLSIVSQYVSAEPSWQRAEAVAFAIRSVGLTLRDIACSLHGGQGSVGAHNRHLAAPAAPNGPGALAPRRSSAGNSPACPASTHPQFVVVECVEFLVAFFTEAVAGVRGGNPFGRHPAAVASVCRAIASFAKWFQMEPRGPLEGALQFLLWAMTVEEMGGNKHAATAFNSVCSRCNHHLARPAIIETLLAAARPALSPPLQSVRDRWLGQARKGVLRHSRGSAMLHVEENVTDRGPVVEGLSRIIAQLPIAAAVPHALALTAPLHDRIASILAQGEALPALQRDAVSVCVLASEIHLLASAVRFLEFPSAARGSQDGEGEAAVAPHPVVAVVERSWPLLTAVLGSEWSRAFEVATSICDVMKRSLLATRATAGGRSMVPSLLKLGTSILVDKGQPMGLEIIGLTAELYGREISESAAAAEPLAQPLEAAFRAGCECAVHVIVAMGPGDDRRVDMYRYLFDMCAKVLLFLPQLHLSSNLAPTLLQLAMYCFQTARERDALHPTIAWLAAVVTPGEKQIATRPWQQYGLATWTALEPVIPALLESLFTAFIDTCPRQLTRSLAGALYGLISNPVLGPAARSTLPGVVKGACAGLVAQGAMEEGDVDRFLACVLRAPPLPKPLFDALLSDFSLMCRKEASSDVLLSYAMQ